MCKGFLDAINVFKGSRNDLIQTRQELVECKRTREELRTMLGDRNSDVNKLVKNVIVLTDKYSTLKKVFNEKDAELSKIHTLRDFTFPDVGWITSQEAIEITCRATSLYTNDIYVSDSKFCLVDDSTMRVFLELDPTDKYQYEPNDFDCDNFAVKLKDAMNEPSRSMLMFAEIWSRGDRAHAFCGYINQDRRFMSVEPQTDKLSQFDEWDDTSAYKPVRFAKF